MAECGHTGQSNGDAMEWVIDGDGIHRAQVGPSDAPISVWVCRDHPKDGRERWTWGVRGHRWSADCDKPYPSLDEARSIALDFARRHVTPVPVDPRLERLRGLVREYLRERDLADVTKHAALDALCEEMGDFARRHAIPAPLPPIDREYNNAILVLAQEIADKRILDSEATFKDSLRASEVAVAYFRSHSTAPLPPIDREELAAVIHTAHGMPVGAGRAIADAVSVYLSTHSDPLLGEALRVIGDVNRRYELGDIVDAETQPHNVTSTLYRLGAFARAHAAEIAAARGGR